MGYSGTTEPCRGRTCAERMTEALTVAVASVLSLVLLAGPAVVFGTTAWHLVGDAGAAAYSRVSVPVIFLAITALPLVLARVVFRRGRRRGQERLTAAVPAVLTLLGGSVVLAVALGLFFASAA
ncbi:hypothetical protein ACWC10_16325 [Streptomyces sp. NPDC001595]|uniref:hypothetical protein n=1 Tax=Streptomyces sp. NPDC001532 TaxID=3154520 RepID=UPI00332F7789